MFKMSRSREPNRSIYCFKTVIMPRCAARKTNGKCCHAFAVENGIYCVKHAGAVDTRDEEKGEDHQNSDVDYSDAKRQKSEAHIAESNDGNKNGKSNEPTIELLTNQLNDLSMKVDMLANMMSTVLEKKNRQSKSDSVLKKALKFYYHEMKNHERILSELSRRNYEKVKDNYKWHDIKRITDEDYYCHLTQDQRDEYYNRAKVELEK